jgi:hypothetical protein
MSPPPPAPCTTRQTISSGIDVAVAQRKAPITKITIATSSTGLRPNRSPSLPCSGIATVAAARYAVMTAGMRSNRPRSAATAGSAGAIAVWSRAPSSITSMRPGSTRRAILTS